MADALIDDIFGDDVDDVENASESMVVSGDISHVHESDSDDIFGSAEDVVDTHNRTEKTTSKKPVGGEVDERDGLFDSDFDDDVEKISSRHRKLLTSKSVSQSKKRNRLGVSNNKSKSLKRKRTDAKEGVPKTAVSNAVGSGDEYDSDVAPVMTAADHDFIDDADDEDADLLREYAQDKQDFDDERPIGFKKKISGASSSTTGTRLAISSKDTDPLSQTLLAMKNPKAKGMTDAEKEVFVDKLQRRMQQAAALDERLFEEQKPAVHKLKLLGSVKQALTMKPLHHVLLEKDILSNLRDWIIPRGNKSLPSLSVRQTVYELLLQLPCQLDHLKRISSDKPPIGNVVAQLRKSSMETDANKRLLKQIMEKWSRSIFSKNADVRLGNTAADGTATASAAGMGGPSLVRGEHEDFQREIAQRYSADKKQSEEGEATTGASGDRGSLVSTGFQQLIGSAGHGAGAEERPQDPSSRVRTPYNKGFLFSVQPVSKSVDKRDVLERTLGEKRSQLMRKMIDSGRGSGNKGLGKKTNPRAMDMSVSGGGVKR